MDLILLTLVVILLSKVTYSQDACVRLTTDALGHTNSFSEEGLVSKVLTDEMGTPVAVKILNTNIVCEAQHAVMEHRYSYTSVVVSFNCNAEYTDSRLPNCSASSVVLIEQFDLGCADGNWTARILNSSDSAHIVNPIATLTTELDTSCILCIKSRPSCSTVIITDCQQYHPLCG